MPWATESEANAAIQDLIALAFTGALIDQIVYRLYGLTPAEIKRVEESGKK